MISFFSRKLKKAIEDNNNATKSLKQYLKESLKENNNPKQQEQKRILPKLAIAER